MHRSTTRTLFARYSVGITHPPSIVEDWPGNAVSEYRDSNSCPGAFFKRNPALDSPFGSSVPLPHQKQQNRKTKESQKRQETICSLQEIFDSESVFGAVGSVADDAAHGPLLNPAPFVAQQKRFRLSYRPCAFLRELAAAHSIAALFNKCHVSVV